jgi:hypothetical protein
VIRGEPADLRRAWLEPPIPSVAPPAVHAGSLVRPEFRQGSVSSFGAYGAVIEAGPRNLVLTALHVLDEVARRNGVDTTAENAAYSGEELGRVITRVNLYDVLEQRWAFHCLGTARAMLVLPDARTRVEEPLGYRDIAAFVVSETSRVRPLRLADAAPSVGEPVWLAGRFENGSRLCAAVVVEKTERSYVFRFAAEPRGPKYTSGAPLLNAAGEVVAINVGAGRLEGHCLGHAIHADSIHSHLRAAHDIAFPRPAPDGETAKPRHHVPDRLRASH